MGERERIAHIEDDSGIIAMVAFALERSNHEIVATATTLEEGLALVQKLREIGVTSVIVDGNLNHSGNTGEDGRKITAAIKSEAPDVKVILLSGQPYDYGDRFVLKSAFRRNQPGGNIRDALRRD